MNRLATWWHHQKDRGIAPDTSPELRKRIRIGNGLTLVLVAIGAAYTPFWALFGQPEMSAITAAGTIGWIGAWALLARGHHLVGRAATVVTGVLTIFAYSELFDTAANLSIYLLNAATLPAVMFTARESKVRWSLTAAGFLLWVATEVSLFHVPHVPGLSTDTYRFLHANSMVLNFVFLGATMAVSTRENHASEARLQDVVRTLEAEVAVREQAEADAGAALTAHQRFLAMISHELRTPMNGVLGMVHLLGETTLEREQQTYVDLIDESGQLMLSLVDDLLDMSKLQAGAMVFDPKETAVTLLLERAIAPMRLEGETRGVQVALVVAPGVPERLNLDAQRLRQVITNLVGNAMKFTERGRVTVRVRWLTANDDPTLPIDIEDTGIGIAEDGLAKIFLPFIQAETSTSRRFGGTGLGLPISRQLVELMRGELTVTSALGIGTTFRIRLPIPALDATSRPQTTPTAAVHAKPDDRHIATQLGAASAQRDPPLDVIVADDNVVNQTVLRLMLMGWGHSVRIANSGAEAVALVRQRCPDVVLMDLQMPEMDGVETTQQIRMLGAAAATLRVVACTASVLPEDRARCMAAGMHEVVMKPIQPAELRAALRR